MSENSGRGWVWICVIITGLAWLANREKPSETLPVRGDSAIQGGSPTIRKSFTPRLDDPETTNDESNDQPKGYFGTCTILAHSVESDNTYALDADMEGDQLTRLYFPKGGWVDFVWCELEDFEGDCEDEQGRQWVFEGEG